MTLWSGCGGCSRTGAFVLSDAVYTDRQHPIRSTAKAQFKLNLICAGIIVIT